MKRLSAPDRTREELRALINGELGTTMARSDLVRLALRLIVEEALEGEVADAVGRERYERAEGAATGYRNGYRPGKIKTAEGLVAYAAPRCATRPSRLGDPCRARRPDRGAGAAGDRAR
jgi:putative transposase